MSWDILPKGNLQYFLTKLKGIFDNKVDKETGKGLFSGNYNDLTNKPTIPAAQVNSDWNASSGVAQILNKPTIPAEQIQSDWSQTTTTAKDYIKNKPTIPAAQVNSDWNANSGVAQILNKPTSMPASDVYAWAKATTKPSYTASEVGALASDGTAAKATADADGNTISSTYMKKGVDRVTAGQLSGSTLGTRATAEGYDITASGVNSHGEGSGTTAEGENSHAEGNWTFATGFASHTEGEGTYATKSYSHAEGYHSTASGTSSHAEGYYSTASGNYSHAEGFYNIASGNYSHVEGYNNVASGNYSHAEGYQTKASSDYQHTEGKYNVEDTNGTYAHIIGGGTNKARKNIFTVDWNGVVRDGTQNRLMPYKAVSEAEYAALSQAEKTNGTAYFRYEATGIMRQIQDNGSATSLTSGALPTGQTIESYLNSNLVKVVTFTVASGSSVNFKSLTGIGRLVGGSLEIQATTSASTWKLLGTISHAPSEAVSVPCVRTGNGTFCGMVKIGTNKEIQLYSTQALSGNAISFSFAYRTS